MFVNFDEEVKHIFKEAEREKDLLNHPYVGSEHLFLAILKNSKLKKIFKDNYVTYEIFKEKLINIVGIGSKKNEFILYTPLLKNIIQNSIIESKEHGNKFVNINYVILSILNEEDGIAYSILKTLNVNIDKLYFDIKSCNKKIKKKKSYLMDIATDFTRLSKENKLDPVIGREKEIKMLTEILIRRKKNNPILIGPAGVGKTAIVEGLASIVNSSNCPIVLKNKKIISLDIFSLVSGTKYRGEFEEKMKKIINELEEDNNIILFIDEIHTIVGAGGAEGAIDASNILKPYLARGKIKIIGATTIEEYKKYIEPDAALARRFQNIIVSEPSKKDVEKILRNVKPLYEKHHNIVIPNNILKEIIKLSDEYLVNRYEPDKSIDVLDEVASKVSMKNIENCNLLYYKELEKIKRKKTKYLKEANYKEALLINKKEKEIKQKLKNYKSLKKIATINDVIEVIKQKSNINIVNGKKNYYEILKRKIKTNLIGNYDVVDDIINELMLYENSKNKNTCFSIMISYHDSYILNNFINQIISNISSLNPIKLDFKDYNNISSISKLIGTPNGFTGCDNKNNLFEKIKLEPGLPIIIENYNDACFEVKEILEKILLSGIAEDSKGSVVNFKNTKIFIIDNDKEYKKVGFNNSNIEANDNCEINIKVLAAYKLNDFNMEEKKNYIIKIIQEYVNNYPQFKIKNKNNYIKNLYNILKDNNNYSEIKKTIKNNIKKTIIESLS